MAIIIYCLFIFFSFQPIFGNELKPLNPKWSPWGNKTTTVFTEKSSYKKPLYADPFSIIIYYSIKSYQATRQPILKSKCHFYPVCSRYGLIALHRYGPFSAALMTIERVFFREHIYLGYYYPAVMIDATLKYLDLPETNIFVYDPI